MLDEDFDLKAKIADVFECAAKEVIALVGTDRVVEKSSAETLPEWMTAAQLARYWSSSDEHVFSYARTGLKLTTFRHAWEGACKQAKIFSLRFHDLRHTFATRLRAKGVHEMDIMSLLSHTTLQMTDPTHGS